MRYRPNEYPTAKPDGLAVGGRVRLYNDSSDQRKWWTVQADSEHYTALTRQAPFQKKGTVEYTVIDWRSGVRGPCDLIGQGYGDGSYSNEECDRMLAEFEEPDGLDVSQRNWVRVSGKLEGGVRFDAHTQSV